MSVQNHRNKGDRSIQGKEMGFMGDNLLDYDQIELETRQYAKEKGIDIDSLVEKASILFMSDTLSPRTELSDKELEVLALELFFLL